MPNKHEKLKAVMARRLSATIIALISILFVAGAIFRAYSVDQTFNMFRDCDACFFWAAFRHDTRLLSLVFLIMPLFLLRSRLIQIVARLFIACLGLAFYADIIIFAGLGRQRLQFRRILDFIDPRDWFSFAAGDVRPEVVILCITPIVIGLLCAIPLHRAALKPIAKAHILLGILMALTWLPDDFEDPLNFQIRNFVESQAKSGEQVPYSDTFKAKILGQDKAQSANTIQPGLGRKKDVILLIVESLSSYQSHFFSGILNLTPNLDAIAASHTSYVNFHANSFHSYAGQLSMVAGIPALSRADKDGVEYSLVRLFKERGYETNVYYASPEKYDDFGPLMRRLGVDHFSNASDPFYDGAPRHIFNMVSDEVLYKNALRGLGTSRADKPRFIMILTGSSHQPYVDPLTRKPGLAAAFHYADVQLGLFYRALTDAHFFDHGMLLITGDHHAMNPVTDEERARYGAHASSMVPLVIVESQTPNPRVVTTAFQHADILPTLDYVTSNEYCHSSWRGNLLTGHPPKCIFHSRSDVLDFVDVFCGNANAIVRLHGDKTEVVEGTLPSKSEVLDQLHYERIRSDNTPDCPST